MPDKMKTCTSTIQDAPGGIIDCLLGMQQAMADLITYDFSFRASYDQRDTGN